MYILQTYLVNDIHVQYGTRNVAAVFVSSSEKGQVKFLAQLYQHVHISEVIVD